MFKKLNTKTLAIVLAVLVALVGVVFWQDSRQGHRNFRDTLVSFNPVEVQNISLFPQVQGQEEIRMLQEGKNWKVLIGDRLVDADSSKIMNILHQFSRLRTQRLAATGSERWQDFSVDDSTGTRIVFASGSRVMAELVVGRSSFNQSTRTGITYVRLVNEDEVFAVEGFLGMEVNQAFDQWVQKPSVAEEKVMSSEDISYDITD